VPTSTYFGTRAVFSMWKERPLMRFVYSDLSCNMLWKYFAAFVKKLHCIASLWLTLQRCRYLWIHGVQSLENLRMMNWKDFGSQRWQSCWGNALTSNSLMPVYSLFHWEFSRQHDLVLLCLKSIPSLYLRFIQYLLTSSSSSSSSLPFCLSFNNVF